MNIIVESTLPEPIEQIIASKGIMHVTTEVVNTSDMIRVMFLTMVSTKSVLLACIYTEGLLLHAGDTPIIIIYNVNIMPLCTLCISAIN